MLPEHGHIHVSTPALFITLLFVAAIITIIFAFVASNRRDRRRAELRRLELASLAQRFPQHNAMTRDGHWPADANPEPFSSGGPVVTTALSDPVVTAAYSDARNYHRPRFAPGGYAAPAYAPAYGGYGMDPTLALAEGMIIGELAAGAGHNHTTVINEGPTYVDSSPSYSPSYDSGVSFDSSSSFDTSSSSGGFDVSW